MPDIELNIQSLVPCQIQDIEPLINVVIRLINSYALFVFVFKDGTVVIKKIIRIENLPELFPAALVYKASYFVFRPQLKLI